MKKLGNFKKAMALVISCGFVAMATPSIANAVPLGWIQINDKGEFITYDSDKLDPDSYAIAHYTDENGENKGSGIYVKMENGEPVTAVVNVKGKDEVRYVIWGIENVTCEIYSSDCNPEGLVFDETKNTEQKKKNDEVTTDPTEAPSEKVTEAAVKADATEATDGNEKTVEYANFDGSKINLLASDPNDDGQTDAKDATLVLTNYADSIANKSVMLTPEMADANGDGVIDAKDATLILRYYADLLAR